MEIISKHRNVWIVWRFVLHDFPQATVSFVHRAAVHSLGLGAKGKMGCAVWDWWGSRARGVREPRDLHEYFMLHMKYHGP